MFRRFNKRLAIRLRILSQIGNAAKANTSFTDCRDLDFLSEYKELIPEIHFELIDKQEQYSWVGGSFVDDIFISVPNGSSRFLIEEKGEISYIETSLKQQFKWTGGGLYDDRFYCFPRSSNSLLYLDIKERNIGGLNIGITYDGEHHYGGVITPEGCLYQPPRNCDHILKIDLNTFKTKKIPLCKWIKLRNYRYCGSVLHPNGLIYFLPETGQKVICLDPQNDKIGYLNGIVDGMVFDAKVLGDGCIYGFSAYGKGILKVDPSKAEAMMTHTDMSFGCYGSKLGPNGKLYGIPGDGDDIWEYDVIADHIRSIGKMPNPGVRAKCAGGATNQSGDIYGVPAFGDQLLRICFNHPKDFAIESDLYNKYFKDNY